MRRSSCVAIMSGTTASEEAQSSPSPSSPDPSPCQPTPPTKKYIRKAGKESTREREHPRKAEQARAGFNQHTRRTRSVPAAQARAPFVALDPPIPVHRRQGDTRPTLQALGVVPTHQASSKQRGEGGDPARAAHSPCRRCECGVEGRRPGGAQGWWRPSTCAAA